MQDMEYDLCIVGAGFFGSCAARHASTNPSHKICLVGLDEPSEEELYKREIFSSHYDEGRIVTSIFPTFAFQDLARQSIKQLREVEKLSGIKFYSPVGFMNAGKKGNRLMKYMEDVSSEAGAFLVEVSDKDFSKKLFPFLELKDDEYGLLDYNGAGIISARKMLEAERKISHEQGYHIITDSVTEVGELRDGYHMVETVYHGKIKAKRILFTTGAFTNVNNFKILPKMEIYVYKEMAVLVKIPTREVERLSSMPGMVYKRDEKDVGSYILPPVQYPDGNYYLKIGSMMYDSGQGMQTTKEIKDWFLSKEIQGEIHDLSRLLFQAIPGLVADGMVRKVCVTCETPTSFPYIDQISPTVSVAVAANGWGASTAEEIGRIAAQLCLTGSWNSRLPKSLFEIVVKKE